MTEVSLRDHQIADLAFYMSTPRCGNFSDPGTGKTPSICVYMQWLWEEKGAKSVFVMPKSLLKKNRVELLRFTNFKESEVVIIEGTPKAREKQMSSPAKVFITGFDCFTQNWETLLKYHPDIKALIGDEWHLAFKTSESKRTKSLYEAMEHIEYLVAATGTIIDGRLDTAYPLIQLCRPGSYSGGWWGFKMAHAIENEYGQVVAWRDPERVGKIFSKMAIRHSFEEVYGKEAKEIQHELCEMDPKQRKAYDEFGETALLELEESWLDGSLPGVNLIRCRQLMEHPQAFGPPLDQIKTTGKEDRLQIHLEDHKRNEKPLLIFSALTKQHDRLEALCLKMGFRVGVINGKVSSTKRNKIDEDFREGKLDIVIGSAATMGVGYNWGHVDHIIFASLDYMDSSFVQGYRRAIRGKRTSPLLITILEYEDSVDQKIFAIVEKKSKMASDVDPTKDRLRLRPKQKPKKTLKLGIRMSEIIK